jgi:hypothetical protein
MRANELGLLQQLPADKDDWKDKDHHVAVSMVSS